MRLPPKNSSQFPHQTIQVSTKQERLKKVSHSTFSLVFSSQAGKMLENFCHWCCDLWIKLLPSFYSFPHSNSSCYERTHKKKERNKTFLNFLIFIHLRMNGNGISKICNQLSIIMERMCVCWCLYARNNFLHVHTIQLI